MLATVPVVALMAARGAASAPRTVPTATALPAIDADTPGMVPAMRIAGPARTSRLAPTRGSLAPMLAAGPATHTIADRTWGSRAAISAGRSTAIAACSPGSTPWAVIAAPLMTARADSTRGRSAVIE